MAKKYSNTGYSKCILIILANLSSGVLKGEPDFNFYSEP